MKNQVLEFAVSRKEREEQPLTCFLHYWIGQTASHEMRIDQLANSLMPTVQALLVIGSKSH